MNVPLLGRRSDRTQNPANRAKSVVRSADIPRLGRSENYALLQDFPGKSPAYAAVEGPLDTPCWAWLHAKTRKGYGFRWVDNRRVTVHRELVGPIGSDEDAHHLCGVPGCVNPDHIQRISKAAHARLHQGGRTAYDDIADMLVCRPGLTPAEIAAATGHSRMAVNAALHRAYYSGRVRRLGAGRYELVEAAA